MFLEFEINILLLWNEGGGRH